MAKLQVGIAHLLQSGQATLVDARQSVSVMRAMAQAADIRLSGNGKAAQQNSKDCY